MTETTLRYRTPGPDSASRLESRFVTLFGWAGAGEVTAWSPLVRIRLVVISAITVAAILQQLDRIGTVLALLGVAAILQPLVAWRSRDSASAWRTLFVLDLVVSTAIAAIEPSVVINQLLLTIGLIGAAATCFGTRGFLAYAAAALVSLAVVLARSDLDQPMHLFFAAALMGIVFGGWILRFRLTTHNLVEDLGRTVDAAGGLFFTAVVDERQPSFLGDIESILGWSADDAEMTMASLIHPDDFDDYWISSERLMPGVEIERTARFRTSAGGWKWMHETSRVVERDGSCQIRGLLVDRTDQVVSMRRATAEATTDSLTGLANRRMLVDLLDREPIPGRRLALLDLDSFKRVNDTLGHAAGDELLRVVAERIAMQLRPGDLAVRLGGDEFALALAPSQPGETQAPIEVVERVLQSLTTPISLNGVVVNTSASAGVVVEEEAAGGSTLLLRRADIAMYEAKRGAGGWELFTPDLDHDHGRKAQLVRDLPEALASGQLRLFFQPIVDVPTGEVVGAEGLARWSHPTFGLLMPADFLDVVLVSVQAGTFTRAMVANGMDAASRLDRLGLSIRVAVNIPVGMLDDDDCCDWFFARCEATGLSPGRMVFEISERELHVSERAGASVEQLALRGVGISIDDFGTGHATFDRLRWRGAAHLKLERSLVQGAVSDPRDSLILANVVNLAKELGYDVVGEGVETVEQHRRLAEVGVDYAQGYLFSEALELEAFVSYASESGQRRVAAMTERAI